MADQRTAATLVLLGFLLSTGLAHGVPVTSEVQDYLIVGMKKSANGDAVNVNSSFELGANQEMLSTFNPNTRDVFLERWTRAGGGPSGGTDLPPAGAGGIFEGIDWTGNVAVTSRTGEFSMSDVSLYADLGVHCTSTPCDQSVSNSTWFSAGETSSNKSLPNQGVSTFDPNNLLGELSTWKTFIKGLSAESTITKNLEDLNALPGNSGPYVTDLDALDVNNDGLAVIDVKVDGDWNINNTEWILQGSEGTLAIFRIVGDTNMLIDNSSILLGDGGIAAGDDGVISQLGALFFKDEINSSDTTFNLNNAILNGIGLWDMGVIGDTGLTSIDINNAQGCAQFIGSTINFNDVRFNRCSFSRFPVPEPHILVLLGIGLAAIGLRRSRRRRA